MRGDQPLARALAGGSVLIGLASAGCASVPASSPGDPPPSALQGIFEDDYGSRYRIDARVWRHGDHDVYEVVRWNADAQYLIARNGAANRSDAGLWTRIDWMPLDGSAPFTWAYCLSAFDAPTREAAEAAPVANRGAPRTGCNGFPFSRMRPNP